MSFSNPRTRPEERGIKKEARGERQVSRGPSSVDQNLTNDTPGENPMGRMSTGGMDHPSHAVNPSSLPASPGFVAFLPAAKEEKATLPCHGFGSQRIPKIGGT